MPQPPAQGSPPVFTSMFGIDLRSLAAFRVAIGILLCLSALLRLPHVASFYTDSGVMPRTLAIYPYFPPNAISSPSFHMMGGEAWLPAALLLFAAVLGGMVAAGYRANLCMAGSWLLLLSLHARNPIVLNGGDHLLRIITFWGMFLPLGPESQGRGRGPSVFSIATAVILIQIAIVYLASGRLKTTPEWETTHTALFMAFQMGHVATPLASHLLEWPAVLSVLTQVIYWSEYVLPIFAFIPVAKGWVRFSVAVYFIAFHLLGIGLTFRLGMFPWIASAMWLLFVPSCFWESIARWRKFNAESEGVPMNHWGKLGHMGCAFVAVVMVSEQAPILLCRADREAPAWTTPIAARLGTRQVWQFFNIGGATSDFWIAAEAELVDGTKADISRTGKPPTRFQLSLPKGQDSAPWRAYFSLLTLYQNSPLTYQYLEMEVVEWNKKNAPNRQVKRAHLVQYIRPLASPSENFHDRKATRAISIATYEGAADTATPHHE